jgi:hypothetical protein
MKTIEIRNRWTGAVLYATEVDDTDEYAIRTAVVRAVAGGADLYGANLRDANLRDANLRDANLGDANLYGANLGDADLGGADLGGADLRDANLRGANLRGADLGGADLGGADLRDANLRGANLRGAHLRGAHLSGAKYESVPRVPKLDAKILKLIESGEGSLDMSQWHSCETTHCRAGWAVHLAGKDGYELERKLGSTAAAGALIYHRSTGRVPDFYASDEDALADLVACAADDCAR